MAAGAPCAPCAAAGAGTGCALRVEGMEEPEVPAPASDVPECVEVCTVEAESVVLGALWVLAPPVAERCELEAPREPESASLDSESLVSESLASAELDASPLSESPISAR